MTDVTAPVAMPTFDHLLHMTDHRATFEHALVAEPRPEHGYCTDDMARVLVVVSRDPEPSGDVKGLTRKAIQFLNAAQAYNGSCRNRMDRAGNWTDQPTTEEHWGRCLWGLGTAAAHSQVGTVRRLAVIQFERGAKARSASPRAMAFAAVGAAELLNSDPDHVAARNLLTDYAAGVAEPTADLDWPWPEPRLAHANAILPEAMIAAGVALEDSTLRQRGLDLLEWLLAFETSDGHLSPTRVESIGAEHVPSTVDRHPLEVASLADACARAAAADPRPLWPDAIRAAEAWFVGSNDSGHVMWDPATGGGYDGLLVDGIDVNQGAESTLAVLSTLQHARRFSSVPQ